MDLCEGVLKNSFKINVIKASLQELHYKTSVKSLTGKERVKFYNALLKLVFG
jgi:hypothetical protein